MKTTIVEEKKSIGTTLKRHVSQKTFFPIDAQKVNVLLIFKGFAKKIKKTSFGRVSTYFYLFLLSSTYNLLITYLSLLNFQLEN